jgi:hypothetical protein
MNCPNCGSKVNKSKYSVMTGYESYRCLNKECNGLFDIKDLNHNKNIPPLIMPTGLNPYHVEYFNKLIKENNVNIPLGAGKSHFLTNIMDFNSQALLITESKMFQEQFIKTAKTKINSRVLTLFRLIRERTILKKEDLLKYDYWLIDELYDNSYKKLKEFLNQNNITNVFYINKK